MLRRILTGLVAGLLLSFSFAAAAEDLGLTGTVTPQSGSGGGQTQTLAVTTSPTALDLSSRAGEWVNRSLTFENVGDVAAKVELEEAAWDPGAIGAGLADPDITQDTPVYPDIPDMVGDYYARPFDPQPRPEGWQGTRLLLSVGPWQLTTAQAAMAWGSNVVTVTKEGGKYRALPVPVFDLLLPEDGPKSCPVSFRSHPELAPELHVSGAYLRFKVSPAV